MNAATILPVSASDAASGVSEAEFKRLLGMPRGREMAAALVERAGRRRQRSHDVDV